MARELAGKSELIEIIRLYRIIFDFYRRQENRLIDKIPFPRLTPVISESLTYHLIKDSVILGNRYITDVSFSKSGGDLEVVENGIIKRVEVKSTAQQAFQYFSNKDKQADYLIWMHFGNVLKDREENIIQITIVDKDMIRIHLEELPSTGKITLSKFRKIFKSPLQSLEIDFNEI